jgi:hypothetical protein
MNQINQGANNQIQDVLTSNPRQLRIDYVIYSKNSSNKSHVNPLHGFLSECLS